MVPWVAFVHSFNKIKIKATAFQLESVSNYVRQKCCGVFLMRKVSGILVSPLSPTVGRLKTLNDCGVQSSQEEGPLHPIEEHGEF